MTAAAPARPPTPRLDSSASPPKPATSRSTPPPTGSGLATAPASATAPDTAPPPAARRPVRAVNTDFLSDKATAAFIRRVLCAQHLAERGRDTPAPIDSLLPPLTSRNDVDLQLYALLSVILREFVQAWYSKITPDETFVAEIVQIIAHCTRALEQRIRNVDLESLLLDELPDLLDRHITTYRIAHAPSAHPPAVVDPREVYHSLNPLAALSPVPKPDDPESVALQRENESLYRQLLVNGLLAVLLPTEDLENDCLTALVGQILSEMIIGNVIVGKISQPWMVWECLIILARVLSRKDATKETLGKVVVEATAQEASGEAARPSAGQGWSFGSVFWLVVHWAFLVFATGRAIVLTLISSSSLPSRLSLANDGKHGFGPGAGATTKPPLGTTAHAPSKVPLLTFKLWTCISTLIEVDARMPWLSGFLSMLQLGVVRTPGRLAGLDGPLDRLFSHKVHSHLLAASHLPPLLRAIRGALFPNNAPGVSTLVAPSSNEALLALRRRCASALHALLPRWLARLYLSGRGLGDHAPPPWRSGPKAQDGSRPASDAVAAPGKGEAAVGQRHGQAASHNQQHTNGPQRADARANLDESAATAATDEGEREEEERVLAEIEEGILDVFSDEYCNRHLLYGVLELVLVRLMPELAEKGVTELWEERLS